MLGPDSITGTDKAHWPLRSDGPLQETVPVGYLTLNAQGRIEAADHAAARLMGRPRLKLIGRPLLRYVDEADKEAFLDHLNRCSQARQGEVVSEVTLINKSGASVSVRLMSVRLNDPGGDDSLIATAVVDVTGQRQAEKRLQETTQQYQRLMENLGEGVCLLDADSNIVFANQRLTEILCCDAREMIGSPLSAFLAEHAIGAEGANDQPRRLDHREQHEFEFHRSTGSGISIALTTTPMFDGAGVYCGAIAQISDITRRKRAEEALRQSEERFRRVADFTYDWEYWIDANGSFLYISPSCQRITEYRPVEFFRDPRLMAKIVHVEDRSAVRHLEAEPEDGSAVATLEFRIVTRSGKHRWIRHVCQPVYGRDGSSLGRRGSNSDITERKQAEEALRLSHRSLEIVNQHVKLSPLFAAFVSEIKNFTKCSAVGIRIVEDNGRIPYYAHEGFSREFCESEGRLGIPCEGCLCTDLVRDESGSRLPYCTPGGSFHIQRMSRYLGTTSANRKASTRRCCRPFGYQSVVLVPIRLAGETLGLIHVADRRENAVSAASVEALERTAMQLGPAIQRVRAEEALKSARDQLEIRVRERTAELDRANRQLRLEISERRLAESASRESEAKFRSLIENMPDVVLMVDREGRIEYINRPGAPTDAVLAGSNGLAWVHADHVQAGSRFLQQAAHTQRVQTCELLDLHGRWWSCRAVPMLFKGAVRSMMVIATDVTERRILENQVSEISSQEQRIGQELHDELGQELTGLGYLAKSLHQSLRASGSPHAGKAAEVASGIQQALGEVRAIVTGLVRAEIDADSLVPALEALAAKVTQRSGVHCRVRHRHRLRVENDKTAFQLYRIAQEAVNNAVKHGQAHKIAIELAGDHRQIRLQVRDDGVGIAGDAEKAAGSGLRIMHYRAHVIGGALDIRAEEHGGTIVTCLLTQEQHEGNEGEQ